MTIGPILRLELRATLRQRLTWLVLGLLVAAMLVGGGVGRARVAAEQATLARVAAEERAAIAGAEATARRYARPATDRVAQFRDPTDTYGYMFNFLTRYATRPPGPLAGLATGQSDLQPAFIRVNFANVFPDASYELKSPRIVALGAFDLGFVLVYILPLAMIALGGTRLAGEQDSGILRMIAAQPVAPITVAAAKFGALALVALPVVLTGTVSAVGVMGAIPATMASVAFGVLLLLVAAYTLLWIAACALAASMWRGAVGALSALVLGWAAATVLAPSLVALALDVALPAPSRLAYVDASRTVADRLAETPDAAARWLAARPDLPALGGDAARDPAIVRLAGQRLTRTALAPARQAFGAHAAALETAGAILRLLSPALVLDHALQQLAGTDAAHQRRLVAAADAHTQGLRDWFEPRVVGDIARGSACADCRGRMTFTDYRAVPSYRAMPARAAPGGGALALLYLAGMTLAAGLLARRRLRRWPQ